MEVKIEVVNVDAVIAGLMTLGESIVGIAADAARAEAEYELPITRERVPIGPTGQLRLSGRVEGPDMEAANLTAGIAYGGPPGAGLNDLQVDYALPVHEDLEAKHPIGQAKWVESVVREELEGGGAVRRMAAMMGAALENLGRTRGVYKSRSGSFIRGPGGRFQGSTPNI